ncbi:hypothetical protein BHE74_00057093 [Ensete ventricosum]|nr:hypothetical protein BHE74_00057093 [Ensete ventricosum]
MEPWVGLPYWLREVANITFRTDNKPFKVICCTLHMSLCFAKTSLVDAGPYEKHRFSFCVSFGFSRILLLLLTARPCLFIDQIENEYNNVARAFEGGSRYIKWAGNMAVGLDIGVPWVMCKQNDPPGEVVQGIRRSAISKIGRGHRVLCGTLLLKERNTGELLHGLPKEPKWGHLRDLHYALKLCSKALLKGTPSLQSFGSGFEARLYEIPEDNVCVAFLTNTNARRDGTVKFRGTEYFLPRRSISILPDCKTVVYNSQRWQMFVEQPPSVQDTSVKALGPQELVNMTKDTTDYLWYATRIVERTWNTDSPEFIPSSSKVSTQGRWICRRTCGGTRYFTFSSLVPILLKEMEANLFVLESPSPSTAWSFVSPQSRRASELCSPQRYFDAPNGKDPVALDLKSMGKGQVWINGESIGRYWVSYLSPLGKPSQWIYHVPRSYLKSKDNLMVVFEEHRGQPEDIQIVTVKRDNICSFVSEFHPPQVRSWAIKNSQIETVVNDAKPEATLSCIGEKVIRSIVFASFGNPSGMCGNFTVGSCHARQAKSVVEQVTLSPPPLIRLIITSDACMLCCNGRPAWGRPAACCR